MLDTWVKTLYNRRLAQTANSPSLSSAGLERAKWPRGKASPWLLVFYFRSISSLAWPSWGTARSLRLALGKKKKVLREKRRLPSPEVWAAPTSKVWRHSDRAWYSPFPSKRPERNHCSQGGVRAIEPPGEVLLGIHGGGVPPGSLNPDLISDQRLVVFHICFQTRPLKSIPAFRPGL